MIKAPALATARTHPPPRTPKSLAHRLREASTCSPEWISLCSVFRANLYGHGISQEQEGDQPASRDSLPRARNPSSRASYFFPFRPFCILAAVSRAQFIL